MLGPIVKNILFIFKHLSMFKKYGIFGLVMIIVAQMGLFFRLQPIAQWYFPILWFGYILLIDAVIFKLQGRSLISSKTKLFLIMLPVSSAIWWMFEGVGFILKNWYYTGLEGFGSKLWLFVFGTLSFATVIPAVFETAMLLKTLHLFDRVRLKHGYRLTKRFLHILVASGIACLVLPLAFPFLFFPLIWIAFFLLLDPINYLHGRPSIISHLYDRKLSIPLSLYIGATLCGFLWEFWNYWAIPKWHYSIPFVNFMKIFEMPLLGYLGYGPFGLELYAMYHFAASLIYHRETYIFK